MADNDRRNASTEAPGDGIKALETVALYSWWEGKGTQEEVFKALGTYVVAGHPLRAFIEMHPGAPDLSHCELSHYLGTIGWTQFAVLPSAAMTRDVPPPDAVGRDLARLVRTFSDTLSVIERHRKIAEEPVRASAWDQPGDLGAGEVKQ